MVPKGCVAADSDTYYILYLVIFPSGAQVITHMAFPTSIGELAKPFNCPAPTGKWDLLSQPPCK